MLYGAGELAEIAALSADDARIEIICVIDAVATARRCAGRPIVADFAAARAMAGDDGVDAVIVTDVRAPQQSFDTMRAEASRLDLAPDRVLAPDLLRVAPSRPAEAR